jgi:hypothetical protein
MAKSERRPWTTRTAATMTAATMIVETMTMIATITE